MINSLTMPMYTLCGSTFTTLMQTISGTKPPVGLTRLAYTICKAASDIIMLCLLMMHVDIVLLENGK